jgi:hypothetical protein
MEPPLNTGQQRLFVGFRAANSLIGEMAAWDRDACSALFFMIVTGGQETFQCLQQQLFRRLSKKGLITS